MLFQGYSDAGGPGMLDDIVEGLLEPPIKIDLRLDGELILDSINLRGAPPQDRWSMVLSGHQYETVANYLGKHPQKRPSIPAGRTDMTGNQTGPLIPELPVRCGANSGSHPPHFG
jgi:hypothetical protein